MASCGGVLVAIDEVGRGALAGPVTVGGVRLSQGTPEAPRGVHDSKQVTPRRREALVPLIEDWVDAWAIAHVPATVIDEIGIMDALAVGARHVARSLMIGEPGVILLDGDQDVITATSRSGGVEHWPVVTQVKADATCASVAAASILAKVARDSMMVMLHGHAPQFGWDGNKGYGSVGHRAALADSGSTVWHRRSWRLLPE